jgi:DNA-binding transcriptional LysR family regulator
MENKSRRLIDDRFEEEGIKCRVIMESGNVELSSRYVEAGIGISFAAIAKGVNPLTGRQLKFISMSKYFEGDYISVICRREKGLPSHIENFISQVLGT